MLERPRDFYYVRTRVIRRIRRSAVFQNILPIVTIACLFVLVFALIQWQWKRANVSAVTSPWTQSDWSGGSGQSAWSVTNKFSSSTGITASTNLTLSLNWYNSSWSYRKQITFDNSAQAENLTNIPILVKLTASNFDFAKAQSAGQDIRFTDSDGTTLLSYEIEKWDNVNSIAYIWVKVPQIDASSSSDSIFMYYGNNSASDAQAATSVWSNGYAAVWHLKESANGTAGEYKDALGVINGQGGGGTVSRVPVASSSGQIDGAQTFTSANSSYISIGDAAGLDQTGDMTVEAWTKPSSISATTQIVLEKGDGATAANRQYSFRLASSNQWAFFLYTGSTTNSATDNSTAPSTSRFDFLTGVRTDNSIKMYTNGSNKATTTISGTTNTSSNTLAIGRPGTANNTYYNGVIDEVRISSVARSANWIAATYKSESDTLNTFSSEQAVSNGSSGSVTSSIFDTGTASDYGTLTYSATTPANTSVSVYVRTGNSPTLTDATAFTSCSTIASGGTMSSNGCVTNTQRYVQYKVALANTDSSSTPTFTSISLAFSTSAAPGSTGFVQRLGNKLYLNGSQFKFSGTNIYQLALSDHPVTLSTISTGSGSLSTNRVATNIDHPTHFEITDAFNTAKVLGFTVVRSHTLGISTGCLKCVEQNLGVFDDTAFDDIDFAISQASASGIKLIIPLTDGNYYYHGGTHDFTDWEGLSNRSLFFSNSTVISDFETYIAHLLNHVNTYTGVALKNDPTIMAWETGNDLSGGTSTWAETIAAYIKSVDTHHLVADGGKTFTSAYLLNSHEDIYMGHYYPANVTQLNSDANTVGSYNKAYIASEYDWTEANGGDTLSAHLSAVESNTNVSGDLLWNLWPHHDTTGFIQSSGYALDYPGVTTGMATRAAALRTHAYAMQGISAPAFPTPAQPYLYKVIDASTGVNIYWRGSAGSVTYTLERSADGGSTWVTVASSLDDTNVPYNDTTLAANVSYQYRIKGVNSDGVSGTASNIQVYPNNFILNGSFDYDTNANGYAHWGTQLSSGGTADFSIDNTTSADGSASAKINVTSVGSPSSNFNVKLRQLTVSLVSGVTYHLTFWAKAAGSRNIDVRVQQPVSPNTDYYANSAVALTTSWQQFSYNFTPSATLTNARLIFSVSQTTGAVWLDGVTLTPQKLVDVAAVPSTSTVSTTWTTELAANSQVNYGLSSGYGSTTTASDTSGVTTHANTISSLVPCVTYHYQAKSTDTATANVITGSDKVLTTTGCVGNASALATSSALITTASGGTTSLLDGSSHGPTLTVPSSFGASDAYFQIHQLNATTAQSNIGAPPGTQIVGNYLYELGALTDVSTNQTTFNSPITVSVAYGISDIGSGLESSLSLYRYHSGVWTQLNSCSLDTSAKTVTCTTPGFSAVALVETGITGSISINSGASYTNSTSANLTLSATDNTAGGGDLEMIIANSSAFTGAAWESYSSNKSWTLTGGDGSKNVYAQFRDAIGNTSATYSASIVYDGTNPSAPGTPSTSSPTNSGSQVWIWTAASDALSGIANYAWRVTDSLSNAITNGTTSLLTVTTNLAEGTYNFFVKAIDNATNNGAESTASVTVDQTAPVTTDDVSTSTYHTTNVSVTLTCTDTNGSGCSHTYYTTTGSTPNTGSSEGNNFTLSSDGVYTIKYFSVDAAGNQESVKTATNQVKIDKTTPTTPGTPSTTSPTSNTQPSWTWTDSVDTGSGLAATPYLVEWTQDANFVTGISTSSATSNTFDQPLALASGTWYLRVRATDVAGNNSAYSTNGTVVIDATAFSLSAINATPNATGATITWTSSTNTSSKVDYGLTSSYGTTTAETDTSPRVSSHTVTLSGLLGCVTYHYRVRSKNNVGTEVVSGDNSFTTTGCTGGASVNDQSASDIATASGGTLNLLSGSTGLTLTLPAAYYSSGANFQIKKLSSSEVISVSSFPSGSVLIGSYTYDIKALTDLTTTIFSYSNPVTVSLVYDASEVSAVDTNSLALYNFDGNSWSKLSSCVVDSNSFSVSCSTENALQVIGLFGQPTSNSQENTSTNTTSSSTGSPGCSDSPPGPKAPWLYGAIAKSPTSVLLYFTDGDDPISYYALEYGLSSNNYIYGFPNIGKKGVRTFLVQYLKPRTSYYFRVRAGNGCAPGNWSNEIAVNVRSAPVKPASTRTKQTVIKPVPGTAPAPRTLPPTRTTVQVTPTIVPQAAPSEALKPIQPLEETPSQNVFQKIFSIIKGSVLSFFKL